MTQVPVTEKEPEGKATPPSEWLEETPEIAWRREQLEEAGMPFAEATQLARTKDCDLHQAVALCETAGWQTAFRICS